MNETQVQKCKKCNQPLVKIYGSGKFCNVRCARQFAARANAKEADIKRSLSQRGRLGKPITREQLSVMVARSVDKRKEKRLARQVVVLGATLDITYRELDAYRLTKLVCEICGSKESIIDKKKGTVRRLAVDHCHDTNKFRGLLCGKCNMNYDWFIKNQSGIMAYNSSVSAI